MKKKIGLFIFVLVVMLASCKEDEYEAKYDDEKIEISYQEGSLQLINNLDFPIILDHVAVNKKEIQNFMEYKVCDYVQYKNEVVINYNEKINQIIKINKILLPKKSITIKYKMNKKDKAVFEFYPITYVFLADNIYFFDKSISTNETKYKLYTTEEVKNLRLSNINTNDTSISELNGIMIFVKEYEILGDYLEKKKFKL